MLTRDSFVIKSIDNKKQILFATATIEVLPNQFKQKIELKIPGLNA